MAGFNNFGVPHYAASDTPAIRPREIKADSKEWLDGKAQQMIARRYVREYIKENWKAGDKFSLTTEKRPGGETSNFPGETGEFIERFQCGNAQMIRVKWDNPKMGKRHLGMFEFYYFAFPIVKQEEPESFDCTLDVIAGLS